MLLACVSLASCETTRAPPPVAEPIPPLVASPPAVAPPSAPLSANGAFTVHVVDVGTGLGVFVEGPDFTLVYDAGSNDDLALGVRNRFVAYLRAARPNLTTIDAVVLSHPHRDHVELLPDVLAAYRVKSVWDSGAVNPICAYRRFVEAVRGAPGLVYHSARLPAGAHAIDFPKNECGAATSIALFHGEQIVAPMTVRLGERATMTILHADGAHHESFNDNSTVAMLDLGGVRVLLMGDAEAGGRERPTSAPTRGSVEGKLLACCRAALDADVLVVGHHGSKSSSRKALLDAVTPTISVISSGPTRYATVTLPDAVIVDELARYGEVLRTDRDDDACGRNAHKIGPDADGRPGGCDNVVVEIRDGVATGRYATVTD